MSMQNFWRANDVYAVSFCNLGNKRITCFSVQPLTTPGPLEGECADPVGEVEWVEYGSFCYLFDTFSTDIGCVEIVVSIALNTHKVAPWCQFYPLCIDIKEFYLQMDKSSGVVCHETRNGKLGIDTRSSGEWVCCHTVCETQFLHQCMDWIPQKEIK